MARFLGGFIFRLLICTSSFEAQSLLLWAAETSNSLATQIDSKIPDWKDISEKQLSQAVIERRKRVPAFKRLQDLALANGFRVGLMGGSASTFARYVKWDLERELGDKNIQPERFDYSFDSIYRTTQDLDLVISNIDGSPEDSEKINSFLESVSQLFPGLKVDVHALKTSYTTKDFKPRPALLSNEDFLNQHNDDMSLSVIELSESPTKANPLRDIPGGFKKGSLAIKALVRGSIEFLYSDKHEQTKYFKEGRNPAIFSVVRYLTKAFRYDLEIPESSWKKIRGIIDEFKISSIPASGYVRNWYELNVRKMLLQAVSKGRAWDTLESLQFRSKIIHDGKRSEEPDTAAWLMSREPLRGVRDRQNLPPISWPLSPKKLSDPLQVGDLISHGTPRADSWEALYADPRGTPNFLISQTQRPGMTAAAGNGVYFQKGTHGVNGFQAQVRLNETPTPGVDYREGVLTNQYVFSNSSKMRMVYSGLPSDYGEILRLLMKLDPQKDAGIYGRLVLRIAYGADGFSEEKFVAAMIPIIEAGELPQLFRALMLPENSFLNGIGLRLMTSTVFINSPPLTAHLFEELHKPRFFMSRLSIALILGSLLITPFFISYFSALGALDVLLKPYMTSSGALFVKLPIYFLMGWKGFPFMGRRIAQIVAPKADRLSAPEMKRRQLWLAMLRIGIPKATMRSFLKLKDERNYKKVLELQAGAKNISDGAPSKAQKLAEALSFLKSNHWKDCHRALRKCALSKMGLSAADIQTMIEPGAIFESPSSEPVDTAAAAKSSK